MRRVVLAPGFPRPCCSPRTSAHLHFRRKTFAALKETQSARDIGRVILPGPAVGKTADYAVGEAAAVTGESEGAR